MTCFGFWRYCTVTRLLFYPRKTSSTIGLISSCRFLEDVPLMRVLLTRYQHYKTRRSSAKPGMQPIVLQTMDTFLSAALTSSTKSPPPSAPQFWFFWSFIVLTALLYCFHFPISYYIFYNI